MSKILTCSSPSPVVIDFQFHRLEQGREQAETAVALHTRNPRCTSIIKVPHEWGKKERERKEKGSHSLRPGYRDTARLPYHVGVPIALCQQHRQGFVMLLILADLKSSGCGIKGVLLFFTIQASKQGLISPQRHPPFLSGLYPCLSSTRNANPSATGSSIIMSPGTEKETALEHVKGDTGLT